MTIRIDLQAIGTGPETDIRVRRLLKCALRSFGLRCVSVVAVGNGDAQAAGTLREGCGDDRTTPRTNAPECEPQALPGIGADASENGPTVLQTGAGTGNNGLDGAACETPDAIATAEPTITNSAGRVAGLEAADGRVLPAAAHPAASLMERLHDDLARAVLGDVP